MIAVSLFSGAGGSDIGAIAAGYTMVAAADNWQVAAESYRRNIGDHIVCGDVASATTIKDVLALAGGPVDLLMASPPCQQYSVARNNNLPRREDADAGAAILEYVDALNPNHVILENVPAYQHAPILHRLTIDLYNRGYMVEWRIVDFADYGVPQNRRRLILQARRIGTIRWPATRPHAGWLAAIADLVDTLPDSEFAPWQLERLANRPEYASFIVDGKIRTGGGAGVTIREDDEPMFTILTSSISKRPMRAYFVPTNSRLNLRPEGEPAQTITAGVEGRLRAFLIPGDNTSNNVIRNDNEPMVTIPTRPPSRSPHRAFLVSGGGQADPRSCNESAMTVLTNSDKNRIYTEGRVVRITPQALARFQTFPDSYQWPDRVADMCRLIGNAVPPLAMQRLLEVYQSSDEDMLCQQMSLSV